MMEKSEIEALAVWDHFRRVAQGASLAQALAGTGAKEATCAAVRVMESERAVSAWPLELIEAVVLRRAAVRATARGFVGLQGSVTLRDPESLASKAKARARARARGAVWEWGHDTPATAESENHADPARPRR